MPYRKYQTTNNLDFVTCKPCLRRIEDYFVTHQGQEKASIDDLDTDINDYTVMSHIELLNHMDFIREAALDKEVPMPWRRRIALELLNHRLGLASRDIAVGGKLLDGYFESSKDRARRAKRIENETKNISASYYASIASERWPTRRMTQAERANEGRRLLSVDTNADCLAIMKRTENVTCGGTTRSLLKWASNERKWGPQYEGRPKKG